MDKLQQIKKLQERLDQGNIHPSELGGIKTELSDLRAECRKAREDIGAMPLSKAMELLKPIAEKEAIKLNTASGLFRAIDIYVYS